MPQTLTLADLFHIPYATRLEPYANCDFMETGRPNVARCGIGPA